ncbi:Mandelate racemase/muconate lactonizing protein [Methylobacterium sp. 4-46]|uniref:enolase C-terminal domain-like protein n=1 Tax=unclassified Methylobacterium TaxID=2615210 RepID=UPI000152E6AE|nr:MULTISPECIES: enolase C-terminal domain-like protein [Methylobacterium]ACA16551.1 Mandelate racemase/muconate lactonizing protein [Methylobacterium sp. 4-46]WFT82260.1 enolase C-terminal domain-like protein [Methylobacterium nodulans]
MRPEAPIDAVTARAYAVPTDAAEADGTFAWHRTTLVVVEVAAGDRRGLGYTYSDAGNAGLVKGTLSPLLKGGDPFDVPALTARLRRRVRNLGRAGLAATAISALDAALWDLKARLLDLPLVRLLGAARPAVAIYGSGGFTSYGEARLTAQLAGFVERDGCRAVKMKIGSDPDRDPDRMRAARAAIGGAALFIDANGAFSPRAALAMAETAAGLGVRWFEEPVSSDDRAGLRFVRERVPAGIDVAAGEYAYSLDDVRHMLEAGAVDVQQADATRCGGVSGFLAAGALCEAHHTDLSGHCAPALHLHPACAAARVRHLEWFHDHVRIESMLFDGAPVPREGRIAPDLGRPGHGLTFKHQDAERYAV